MTPPLLISVHVPKSSGTSLRIALNEAYGEQHILLDYADDPADPAGAPFLCPALGLRRPRTPAGYAAVHGHLPIRLYDHITPALRITMLRHPVATMTSIHRYWSHLADTGQAGHGLYELFRRERPTLSELASAPALRWLLSRSYFGDVDMRRFDIIGCYDRRDAFYAAVSTVIERPLNPAHHHNATPGEVDSADLAQTLRDDVRFYEDLQARMA